MLIGSFERGLCNELVLAMIGVWVGVHSRGLADETREGIICCVVGLLQTMCKLLWSRRGLLLNAGLVVVRGWLRAGRQFQLCGLHVTGERERVSGIMGHIDRCVGLSLRGVE